MREARDWYFREFHPETIEDYNKVIFSAHSGHVRMVLSYWDMAAALVRHDAIGRDMFNDTNGEHFGVFSKVELIVPEIRAAYGPQYLRNLEALIDATPDGRQRTAQVREWMQQMRARFASTPA